MTAARGRPASGSPNALHGPAVEADGAGTAAGRARAPRLWRPRYWRGAARASARREEIAPPTTLHLPLALSPEPHHRHHRRRTPGLDHQGRREALQHERLGTGLFPGERRRARHRASRRQSEARARPLPAGHGPERPGRRASAAAPLLRHPALAHPVARRASSPRHQGVRLRGQLHHGVSGQGQPAAPRGAGDRRVRRPARRGARVRQQARAAGHPRPQREHQPPHRLQRLQGRGVHAAGPDGPEARAHGDDRAGAAERARGAAQGGRRDGRAAHRRRAGQARHRRLGPLGQERRRALEVRPRRGGADAAAGRARSAAAGRTSSSWSTSTSAARSPTSAT